MAETAGTPAPQPAADTAAAYKPLSALAVLAIFVAGAFALCVAGLGLSALITRRPALAPSVLFIGMAGLALAIIGRRHVLWSEGARTGEKLTNLAWWLSIVGLVIYAAYFVSFETAIRTQSREEAIKPFLEALAAAHTNPEQKQNEAFFLMLAPEQRGSYRPERPEEWKSRFDTYLQNFRQLDIIPVLERSKGEMAIESVTGRDWIPSDKGHEVVQTVKLRTPEGELEVVVPTFGDETGTGGRQWMVKPGSTTMIQHFYRNEFGGLVFELQNRAEAASRDWLSRLMAGHYAETVAATLGESHRAEFLAKAQARRRDLEFGLRAAELAAPSGFLTALLNPPIAGLLTVDGFREFHRGRRPDGTTWLDITDLAGRLNTPELRDAFYMRSIRPGGLTPGTGMGPAGSQRPVISVGPNEVIAQTTIEVGGINPQSGARTRGKLRLALQDADLLARITKARAEGFRAPPLRDLKSDLIPTDRKLSWQVVSIRCYDEAPPAVAAAQKPGR